MDPQLRSQLLLEAQRIGDHVLSRAEQDEDGVHWKTLTADPVDGLGRPSELHWKARENLYSGVAGIALFLIELARQTGSTRFLGTAAAGLGWVARRVQRGLPLEPGLFVGRLGVARALLRLAEVEGDRRHAHAALEIAAPAAQAGNGLLLSDDLLQGRAGIVIGLLDLHAATEATWARARSQELLDELIERACPWRTGLYWDHGNDRIRGLCGLAHGASGVGLALLEAAAVFDRHELVNGASEAFAYEDASFDPILRNWPDLRAPPSSHELAREAHLELERTAPVTPGNTSAWCHGAIGIGLCRVRAHQLEPHDSHILAIRRALSRALEDSPTEAAPPRTWTLCHGHGAAIELLAQASEPLKDIAPMRVAEEQVALLLADRARGNYRPGFRDARGERDLALFTGEAGIGYLLLRLIDPMGTPSVLVPRARQAKARHDPSRPHARPAQIEVQRAGRPLLKRAFPRTLRLAQALSPAICDSLCARFTCPSAFHEQALLDGLRSTPVDDLAREALSEIHGLERAKWIMDTAVESYASLAAEEQVQRGRAQRMLALSAAEFEALQLVLCGHSSLRRCRWNWDPAATRPPTSVPLPSPGDHAVLLMAYSALRTVEHWLGPFVDAVLSRFAAPQRVVDVAEAIDAVNDAQLHALLVAQVRSAVRDGVLVNALAELNEPVVGRGSALRPANRQ
jgi:hypothetical protein